MCRFSSLLYPTVASLIGSWTWHAPWTTTHSWTQQHHTTWPDAHLIRRTTMLKKTVTLGQIDDPYHTNWAIPPTHLQSPNLIRLSTTKYIENEHELFFQFLLSSSLHFIFFFPWGSRGSYIDQPDMKTEWRFHKIFFRSQNKYFSPMASKVWMCLGGSNCTFVDWLEA